MTVFSSAADGLLKPPERAVLLVTADWCQPCRPALTLLAELARKYHETVIACVAEVMDDGVTTRVLEPSNTPLWSPTIGGDVTAAGSLELWLASEQGSVGFRPGHPSSIETLIDGGGVEVLPTWVALNRPDSRQVLNGLGGAPSGHRPPSLDAGHGLSGTIVFAERRPLRGALPKHEVERQLFRG